MKIEKLKSVLRGHGTIQAPDNFKIAEKINEIIGVLNGEEKESSEENKEESNEEIIKGPAK